MESHGQKSKSRGPVVRWVLFLAVFAGVWGLALVFLDVRVANHFKSHPPSGWVIGNALFFNAYCWPIPLLLLAWAAMIAAGPARWRLILHLVLGYVCASALVWAGKFAVARQRPGNFTGASWRDTFHGFFKNIHEVRFQSLPSGDAATGFVVSFILARYFPKYRFILYILAAGCAASRIVQSRHYVSDVLLGALLGYLAARIVNFLTTSGPARTS